MDVVIMRYYYTNGLWSLERLDKLLQAGKITQAQLDDITATAEKEGN